FLYRVAGQLVPLSSSLRVRGGVHPGQVSSPPQDKQPCTHPLIPKNYLVSHVFGLCEEASVPGKNPRMHRENKTPGTSFCKATVPPTVHFLSKCVQICGSLMGSSYLKKQKAYQVQDFCFVSIRTTTTTF
ncbi:hypothetical protein GOODEAATRI_008381, partial [Goodea atripinnis]